MPRMADSHSAMQHSFIGDNALVVQAHSCQSDCSLAERLNISRRFVPQVTVVQTDTVVLEAAPKFLDHHLESEWSLDSGPPFLSSAYTVSYGILRI
jgi:hypothetical protein